MVKKSRKALFYRSAGVLLALCWHSAGALLVFCWCSAGTLLAHVIHTWKLEKAAPKLEVYLFISIHEAGNLLIHKY